MKSRLYFILLLICAYTSLSHAHAGCIQKTLTVNTTERTEIVCVPTSASTPMPVLLVFHGRGGSGSDIAEGTRFHEVWPEALVVYLDGLPGIPAPYDIEGRYPGGNLIQGKQIIAM